MEERLGIKNMLRFRKIEILSLMALGYSCRDIGNLLGISVYTVRTYLCRVIGELGANGRAHAVTLALLKGLLDLEALEKLESEKELGIDWTWGPIFGEILTLVALGYPNKEIGRILSYNEQHIKNMVHSMLDKFGARNRVHLTTLSLIQRKLDLQGLRIEMATK